MTITASTSTYYIPPSSTSPQLQVFPDTIPKEYRLHELMKDEKFQLIFKQVVADNINRLELGKVYAAILGGDRIEKAENLLKDFADYTQKKAGLNANIRQLDTEIADLEGQIEAYTYLLTQSELESGDVRFLMGTACKSNIRQVLIVEAQSKIAQKQTLRTQVLAELVNL